MGKNPESTNYYFGVDCVALAQVCDPCDTNCDGAVDSFDIEPFIVALLGLPGCSPCAGDANGDGALDAFDIEPFVACLF